IEDLEQSQGRGESEGAVEQGRLRQRRPGAAPEVADIGPDEQGVLGEIDEILSAGQEPLADGSLEDEKEHRGLNGEAPLPYRPHDRAAAERDQQDPDQQAATSRRRASASSKTWR